MMTRPFSFVSIFKVLGVIAIVVASALVPLLILHDVPPPSTTCEGHTIWVYGNQVFAGYGDRLRSIFHSDNEVHVIGCVQSSVVVETRKQTCFAQLYTDVTNSVCEQKK